MNEKPTDLPDRPIECTECKRGVKVIYTEIIGKESIRTSMCSECPELHKRLHGTPSSEGATKDTTKGITAGLACGECGTNLDSVRMGTPLGCSSCYDVFDHALLTEMVAARKVPSRLETTQKKSVPFHIGRAPGETPQLDPSLRLLALNEALTDTLQREEYEQAALLRDQIKELTEETGKGDQRKK